MAVVFARFKPGGVFKEIPEVGDICLIVNPQTPTSDTSWSLIKKDVFGHRPGLSGLFHTPASGYADKAPGVVTLGEFVSVWNRGATLFKALYDERTGRGLSTEPEALIAALGPTGAGRSVADVALLLMMIKYDFLMILETIVSAGVCVISNKNGERAEITVDSLPTTKNTVAFVKNKLPFELLGPQTTPEGAMNSKFFLVLGCAGLEARANDSPRWTLRVINTTLSKRDVLWELGKKSGWRRGMTTAQSTVAVLPLCWKNNRDVVIPVARPWEVYNLATFAVPGRAPRAPARLVPARPAIIRWTF